MSDPTTEAGRRLLDFIDAAIENTTNGVSWRNGAGYARVCAASSIPAIEREARREAHEKVRAALTDEDEIAHGEAVVERNGRLLEMKVCAYCQSEWPCRTQRGIDRLLAAIDTLMGDDDGR